MKFKNYLKVITVIFFIFSILTLTIVAAEPSHAATTDEKAREILELVNIERANNGLAPLTLDKNLTKVSQVRANEIVYKFSHQRENGKYWTSLMDIPKGSKIDDPSGFAYNGENIAAGQKSAEDVMSDWMKSPTHRSNILSPHFTKLGVGFVYIKSDKYHYYWTQLFSNYNPSIKKQTTLKTSYKLSTVTYKKKKYTVRTYKFLNIIKNPSISTNYKIKTPKNYNYFKSYKPKNIIASFNKKTNILTLNIRNLLLFNGNNANTATIKVAFSKKK